MTEDELWTAAYYIAWVGASNPRGVRHTLDRAEESWPAHPATRAISGHLDYLERRSPWGPSYGDLELVYAAARRLGLIRTAC